MSATLLHAAVLSLLLSGFTKAKGGAPEPFKGETSGSRTEAASITSSAASKAPEAAVEVTPRPGQILATARANEEQVQDKAAATKACKYLITVADDFIVAAYKNGEAVPREKRELLLDRFGATAEKINIEVQRGDWIVFQVVQNPVRWGGSKYFAVAGCYAPNEIAFVSDPASKEWSVCDDPAQVAAFIKQRNVGANARANAIEHPWSEGEGLMKRYAGESFAGKALWGKESTCWIKYLTPPSGENLVEKTPQKTQGGAVKVESPAESAVSLVEPKRWPVQIVSAIYGTAGKNADVTAKVKEYVEKRRVRFASNPKDLGADPNPYWNKDLHIIYLKDGVRREQHRNENEHILPESFYGPQDAGELRAWLPETRWSGPGGEVQFHGDGTFTMLGSEKRNRWEAVSAKTLKLTWAEKEPVQFNFDYTWESFSEVENGKNVFHVVR